MYREVENKSKCTNWTTTMINAITIVVLLNGGVHVQLNTPHRITFCDGLTVLCPETALWYFSKM